MLPGQYEFNTVSREFMEIISGKLSLKLQNFDDWQLIKKGMNFIFPNNTSFKAKLLELVNYTCSYYDD